MIRRASLLGMAIVLVAWMLPAAAQDRDKVESDWVKEDPTEFAKFCEDQPCRRDVEFSVRKEDGSEERIRKELMQPAIQGSMLTVLPGETIEAVADFKDGKFQGWRAPLATDGPSTRRVTITLTQNSEDAGMMAHIVYKGPSTLKVKMGLISLDDDQPVTVYTSSCPWPPGTAGYENWPYPFMQLVIGDVIELDANAPMVCE